MSKGTAIDGEVDFITPSLEAGFNREAPPVCQRRLAPTETQDRWDGAMEARFASIRKVSPRAVILWRDSDADFSSLLVMASRVDREEVDGCQTRISRGVNKKIVFC